MSELAYWKPFEIDAANKRIVLGSMDLPDAREGAPFYDDELGPITPARILIPPESDLFAPVDGFAVVDSDGLDEGVCPDSIARTVFGRIDANSQKTFYAVTRWPERVLDVWPMPYKNVCYALQINHQADLSKVPDLLKLKELCGGLALRVEPEEAIDIRPALWCESATGGARENKGDIAHVFVDGDWQLASVTDLVFLPPTNGHKWRASILRQCREANIPVYVESDDVPDDLKVREIGVPKSQTNP